MRKLTDTDTDSRTRTRSRGTGLAARKSGAGTGQVVIATASFTVLTLAAAWVMLLAVVYQVLVVGLLAALAVARFGCTAHDLWRPADPEHALPSRWGWRVLGCGAAVALLLWLLNTAGAHG